MTRKPDTTASDVDSEKGLSVKYFVELLRGVLSARKIDGSVNLKLVELIN